jgi:hypothetical protein
LEKEMKKHRGKVKRRKVEDDVPDLKAEEVTFLESFPRDVLVTIFATLPVGTEPPKYHQKVQETYNIRCVWCAKNGTSL